MSSKVPALIDYLVAEFTAAPTLGAASPPVTVFDGPPTTALDPGLKLYVGLTDPDTDTIDPAARFTQARSDMGNLTRDEVSEIVCVAEAWSGSDAIATVRVAAFAIAAAVETLVRADSAQFGGNAALAAPGVSNGELLQNATQTGAMARVTFSLTFKSFT